MNLENDSEKPDFSPFCKLLKKADPVKGLWRARNRARGQNGYWRPPELRSPLKTALKCVVTLCSFFCVFCDTLINRAQTEIPDNNLYCRGLLFYYLYRKNALFYDYFHFFR